MKKDWRIYALRGDFDSLAQRFGIDPVVARVIRNRGITTPEEYENYLFGTLDSVNPPETMLDIELGADIIADSIEEGKKIRVVGDYDVDVYGHILDVYGNDYYTETLSLTFE